MLNNMKAHIKNTERGFTLIEIMVSIGILITIMSLGLFISMDFAKSYNVRAENNNMVSILQKARGASLNNINQTRSGVHFTVSPLTYTLFECPTTNPQCITYTPSASDVVISTSYGIRIQSPSSPFDIVFDQLTGCLGTILSDCSATPVTITVDDGVKSYTISINNEGRIDW